MIAAQTVLAKLPPFQDEWITIKDDQEVHDIIKRIQIAHKKFSWHYDRIALDFDADTTENICQNIVDFLNRYVKYKEEPEKDQTTSIPAGFITRGNGDCKHFASFCGGILDAINRLTGKKIKWCYRFVSYNPLVQVPGHVYVVVYDRQGNEQFWIDPVPGASKLTPVWVLDKSVKGENMALRENIGALPRQIPILDYVDNNILEKIAVIDQDYSYYLNNPLAYRLSDQAVNYYDDPVIDIPDSDLPDSINDAIQTIINFGAVDEMGEVDHNKIAFLVGNLPAYESIQLSDAYELLNSTAQVSGFFSDIWRGVKKVSLSPMRGAFLSAVALNVFGMATKMKQATKTQEGVDKVRGKWYSFGGDWAKLRQAIDNGSKRKRIGGIGAAPVVPAWVVTAGAIIAAIMPIVTAILKKQQQSGMDMGEMMNEYGGGDPYAPTPTGAGIMGWIQANPIPAAGIGFLIVNFMLPKEKRILKF